MPTIGIIDGCEEAENAMSHLRLLIKTLNKRFRSSIKIKTIPLGNSDKFGADISNEAITQIKSCDAILSGDIESNINFISYKIEDIAAMMGNYIRYTYIKGFGKHSGINIRFAAYFDGGLSVRINSATADGCEEHRTCSTYAMMRFVKSVCNESELRRRFIVYVPDSEIDFYAEAFYHNFEKYMLPIPNFSLYRISSKNIAEEILTEPARYDTIVTSQTTADTLQGVYNFILGNMGAVYIRFECEKSIYYIPSICSNMEFENEIPSINAYITALADLLKMCFKMEKESFVLRSCAEKVIANGLFTDDSTAYLSAIIDEINKPLETKFKKSEKKIRIIR